MFGVRLNDEDYARICTLSVGELASLIASRATKAPLSRDGFAQWEWW